MSKEFKWTDAEVKNILHAATGNIKDFVMNEDGFLEDYKASHGTEDKREWDIVSFSYISGDVTLIIPKLKSGLFTNGFDQLTENACLKEGYPIHSVRRNEVFTVGDNCFHGPIIRFNLRNDEITADFECGDVGCTVPLSELSKLPQRTKLLPVELTQGQINKLLKILGDE